MQLIRAPSLIQALDISSFLATAEVAEQSVIRKPSVFCFEITAVNVNVVNYIWCLCCLPLEI